MKQRTTKKYHPALLLIPLALLMALMVGSVTAQTDEISYDLVVYGDSSGAVIAAIAAKRQGLSVVLVNPTHFLGGMSASGLGATDFLGKRATFGGITSEFYGAIAEAYGKKHVRSFEPHVGQRVFNKMIADAKVHVVFNEKLNRKTGVEMDGKRIVSFTTLSGKTFRGKMFIDATYVGDLMAAAGVTYTVGREAESQYGESLAGVRRGDTKPRVHYTQGNKDHFIAKVDGYVVPGDPASGLLPHVHKIEGLKNGQGDRKIQGYNYRLCLTTDPTLKIPLEKPEGYREIDHELLLRNFDAGDKRMPALIEPLAGTGSKVDWNNMHAVGSDYVGANWEYPEASYKKRRQIEKAHQLYIRGFLWTLANNKRVPAKIRNRAKGYGLPKDEFKENGGWPYMIYIREARRMVSDYVMNEHNCKSMRTAEDSVGLASFGMDSHAVQHIVNEKGHVRNEGVIWHVPPKPYPVSYRSIIPRKGECENLYTPVCLSASHVAHGSIRMEPVFMVLSESSATAAALAISDGVKVQEVNYSKLSKELLKNRQKLE
ncbi:MAG: FAD-dependent oxidoreductase [Akkermansiaceae bacterium]